MDGEACEGGQRWRAKSVRRSSDGPPTKSVRGRAKSVSGRFRRHAADGPETVEKPLDDAALIALWSRAHKLIGQRGLGEAEGVLRELAGLLGSAAPSVGAEGLFHDEGAPRLAATLAASAPLCAALAGAGLVLWLHPRPRLHAPARSAPGRCSAVLWWRARGALDGALVEPAPAGLLALGTALEGPADDWALQEPGGRVMGEGATSAGLIAELSVTVLYAWASSLAGPLVELLIERDEAEQG